MASEDSSPLKDSTLATNKSFLAKRAAFLQQITSFETALTEYIVDQYHINSVFTLPNIGSAKITYEFAGLDTAEKPLKETEIDKINAILGTFFTGKLPGPNIIHYTNLNKSHFQITLRHKKDIRNFLLTIFFHISDKNKLFFKPDIVKKEKYYEVMWTIPASAFIFIQQLLSNFFNEIGYEVVDNKFSILISISLKTYDKDVEKFLFPFCLKRFQTEELKGQVTTVESSQNGTGTLLAEQKKTSTSTLFPEYECFYEEDIFLDKVYNYARPLDSTFDEED